MPVPIKWTARGIDFGCFVAFSIMFWGCSDSVVYICLVFFILFMTDVGGIACTLSKFTNIVSIKDTYV